MKSLTKRITIAGLGAVCALSFAAGAGILAKNARPAFAETAGAPSATYYYDNLTDTNGNEYTLAKKFYDALDGMNKSGDFKDGVVQKSISEFASSDEIKKWVDEGDLTIPRAFSAARDSYFYDHPELFYVDIYKLTLSAGKQGGVYSAYIDCGREANCYLDGGFTSATEVDKAIALYNAEVKKAAEYAVSEYEKSDKTSTFGTERDVMLANYANEYVAENVEYDNEALAASQASDKYSKPYIGNAYGAFYEDPNYGGKRLCICRGYTFAYKAVMDELGIPCVIVSGTSIKKASGGEDMEKGEAHSWNYVWLKTPDGVDENDTAAPAPAAHAATANGSWFAFDVTWNSTGKNSEGYVCMNAFATSEKHAYDQVISTGGYLMPYPELSVGNYGNTTINNDFKRTTRYSKADGKKDNYGNQLMTYEDYVSYKGKGAVALLDEGIHVLCRNYAFNKNTGEMFWSSWFDIGTTIRDVMFMEETGNETWVPAFYESQYIQYAVVDVAPDINYDPEYAASGMEGIANYYYSKDYVYKNPQTGEDEDLGAHTLYISEVYTNKTYGTYTAAPYITKTNPIHTQTVTISDSMATPGTTVIPDGKAITIEVTYDEELHVLDGETIKVNFTAQFGNIHDHARIVNLDANGTQAELLSDKRTIRFKFAPSLMYEHNSIMYSFYFSGVGSSKLVKKVDNGVVTTTTSDKAPNPVHYHFARRFMACPEVFGDGRLWIDCCAQPTLVSNTNMAEMGFKDENGSTFSENSRSQMMLVVEQVSEKTETDMFNEIEKQHGVTGGEIEKSETYDINLQICGKYPTIPDGSYVKIALGFPEGYGPESEGVTFKLYHRKHIGGDKYEIEEVDCVVTKFGIVATVTSFSPYMVAVVKGDSSAKTINATVDGKGGALSKEDGKIQKLEKSGDSYTYTIVPDAGYAVYSVKLNGAEVKDKISGGKLTLTYDEILSNNELEIQYIAEAAAERFEAIGAVDPVKVVVPVEDQPKPPVTDNPGTDNPGTDNPGTDNPGTDNPGGEAGVGDDKPGTSPDKKNNTTAIIICAVLGVIIVACGIALAVVLTKRPKRRD